jgi:hypothetical protein
LFSIICLFLSSIIITLISILISKLNQSFWTRSETIIGLKTNHSRI